MSRTDKYTDAEFLRMLRGHIGERIAACHEAETDERECGDENVAQANLLAFGLEAPVLSNNSDGINSVHLFNV